MNKKSNNINEIGEIGLIKHLTDKIKLKNKSSILGIGDDAAIINHGKNETIVSTDLLIEGVHFDMAFTPLKHLGYKAVTVNLSDIYAMNAHPRQITVSIGISNKFTLEAVEEIYEGIRLASENYGVDIIGGDTTTNPYGLVISITAIGEANKKDLTYRSGAKENDLIIVSGDLGGAYAGLTVLQREKEVWKANPNMQPDLNGYDYILQRQLKPEARKDIIKSLRETSIVPTSMIDISDGLASELLHICKASKVGCQVYEDKLPIDQNTYKTAMDFNINPTTCALNGGEDFELLFTVNLKDHKKIEAIADLTIIGHVSSAKNGVTLISKADQSIPIEAQGWGHFKN